MTTENTPAARARVKAEKLMHPAQRQIIEHYIEHSVPEKHKIATRRALFGQMSRATAVKVKCLQCCNYDREEVRHCAVLTCALHDVRPYQLNQPEDPADDPQDA